MMAHFGFFHHQAIEPTRTASHEQEAEEINSREASAPKNHSSDQT